MRMLKAVMMISLAAVFLHSASAQDAGDLDPEAMKLVDKYKEQNANMPPEVKALMPSYLSLSDSKWLVEESSKMLLQGSLQADNNSANVDGKKIDNVDYKIIVSVYNMKSPMGKMMADSTLKDLRKQGKEEWASQHKAEKDGPTTRSAPEKITVQKGYMLIQKIVVAEHKDGEGNVPSSIRYCGYLYLEVDNGLLTAEIGEVSERGAVEKIMRSTAGNAVKIKWDKFFK